MKALLLSVFLLSAATAQAAGGHHAVDDATILEPGQCEVESWFSRTTSNDRLLHAGTNCRVGPVELGAATEHTRAGGASGTAWALAAKWAAPVAPGVSVGVSATPVWQAHVRPRYAGTAVVGLLTWAATDTVSLHANAGRSFVRQGPDETTYGASAEWTFAARWSAVAERFKAADTQWARAGVRLAASDAWSVDLSRAQRLAGPAPSQWTLGATWTIDRK